MARLSRITTATGDQGQTRLADGKAVLKTDQRIACLGDQDELQAALGLLISALQESGKETEAITLARIRAIQQKLFDFGAELSLPEYEGLTKDDVTQMEAVIRELSDALPPLEEFVLPGPPESAARAHLCRTICRRLERACFKLHAEEPLNPVSLQWLNRLSDWLFLLGRRLTFSEGKLEPQWRGPKRAQTKPDKSP